MSDGDLGDSSESKDVVSRDEGESLDAEKLEVAADKLAKEDPQRFSELFMATMGPVPNPIHQKMDGSHIAQVLDFAADQGERQYDLSKRQQEHARENQRETRWFVMGGLVLFVALIIFLIVWLSDQPSIFGPALSGLAGLASGFLAGLGVGRRQSG